MQSGRGDGGISWQSTFSVRTSNIVRIINLRILDVSMLVSLNANLCQETRRGRSHVTLDWSLFLLKYLSIHTLLVSLI